MLTIQEIVLAFALIGVLGGWALGRIGSAFASRSSRGNRGRDDNHRIRALEADLRVAQRKAEEAELALERLREEHEAVTRELQEKNAALSAREAEMDKLRQSLTDECSKTQGLRAELTARVEENIRAQLRVRDAETELSVARAGSEAVIEQVQRLAAEREELTGKLRALQAETATRSSGPRVMRLAVGDSKER
jgi:chromosome segregation ATPase